MNTENLSCDLEVCIDSDGEITLYRESWEYNASITLPEFDALVAYVARMRNLSVLK